MKLAGRRYPAAPFRNVLLDLVSFGYKVRNGGIHFSFFASGDLGMSNNSALRYYLILSPRPFPTEIYKPSDGREIILVMRSVLKK
jgi:hypothetical protein